eukprot:5979723-Prymnesium_polylepis.1
MDAWGNAAVWQLAMCEFAVEHLDDKTSTPKQLQLQFRADCVAAPVTKRKCHASVARCRSMRCALHSKRQ